VGTTHPLKEPLSSNHLLLPILRLTNRRRIIHNHPLGTLRRKCLRFAHPLKEIIRRFLLAGALLLSSIDFTLHICCGEGFSFGHALEEFIGSLLFEWRFFGRSIDFAFHICRGECVSFGHSVEEIIGGFSVATIIAASTSRSGWFLTQSERTAS